MISCKIVNFHILLKSVYNNHREQYFPHRGLPFENIPQINFKLIRMSLSKRKILKGYHLNTMQYTKDYRHEKNIPNHDWRQFR